MSEQNKTMKVEILGPWLAAPATGSRGACSSYVVSGGGATVLLDCGPGSAMMLQERNLTQRLDAVVISHMDPDHVLGLVPLANLARSDALLSGRKRRRKLPLYVPREDGRDVLASLETVCTMASNRHADVGERGDSPFADIFEYGEDVEALLVEMHIRFRRTRHHRPCYSPRISDDRSVFVYSADTGYTPEMVEQARGADLFLCEATLLEVHPHWTEEHGHLTGELAGRIAAQAGVSRLVLTHLGPDPKINLENLRRARVEFDGAVELAKCGKVIS